MIRAVVYARVSSQIQKDKHTIASQISTLPRYVMNQQGWKLVMPAETYVDDGRTAKAGHLEKREGWKRLVHDMEARLFDVVVVVDQDRLTRSEDMIERAQVLGAFQRHGVKIAVASSGQLLDLGSSEGDLLAMLQAWVAAEHNRKHRERIKRGKLEAISKGKKPAGPTPFGYRYDRVTGAWSVHQENGPVVVEIFERVAAGESAQRIAFDLHSRNVARPRSGFWTRERVLAIVHARTYLGEWTADKAKGLKVAVPRIVSEELFERANDALGRFGLKGLKRNRYWSLCQGIGRCALCQSAIVLSQATSWDKKTKLRYYACSRRLRPRFGQPRCTLPTRRVEIVDDAVWARMKEVLSNPERLRGALAARKEDAQTAKRDWGSDLEEFRRKLRRLEKMEAALLDRFGRGLISEVVMDPQLKRMSAERKLLVRQIETAEQQVAGARCADQDAELLQQAVSNLEIDFDHADPQTKRELLLKLVPGRGKYVIDFDLHGVDMQIVIPEPRTTTAESTRPPAPLEFAVAVDVRCAHCGS